MFLKFFLATFLFINIGLYSLGSFCQLRAQEAEGETIIISDRVGEVIDVEEREKFKLFEGVAGFQSAVYFKTTDNRYFLKITCRDIETGDLTVKQIQQAEASIKIRGYYIDNFETLQAEKDNEKNKAQETKQKNNSEVLINNQGNEINQFEKPVLQPDYHFTNPKTSFYLELLGKYLYSLNIDFRFNKSNAMSLGISEMTGATMPSMMYYHFMGKKSRFELGLGFTAFIIPNESGGLIINGVIGYRYQVKNGLLFRIGFTPILANGEDAPAFPIPWAGLSLGYSF